MKKIFILGLVGMLVLGIGMYSFASNLNRGFRGHMGSFNRGSFDSDDSEIQDFMLERMQEVNEVGYPGGMMGLRRNSNFQSKGYTIGLNQTDETLNFLSQLTNLTNEEILESEKNFYEIAKDKNVLNDFHEEMIEIRENELNNLIDEDVISQEDAEFMLERMEEMNELGYFEGNTRIILDETDETNGFGHHGSMGHHGGGFRR